jgi:hypothetical protein
MISSQDGTEDRLPRADFRPCRPAWSPADSAEVEGRGLDSSATTGAAGADAAGEAPLGTVSERA